MKRGPELLAAGIIAGSLVAGCSSGNGETAQAPTPVSTAPTTSKAPATTSEATPTTSEAPVVDPKVRQLAGNVIKITQLYPGATGGKPPRSIGVTVPYEKGGQLDVMVQTSSEAQPDASRPQEIGMMQTSAGGNTFSVQFLVRDNGNVDVSCTDHMGIVITEENEQTVRQGAGNPATTNPELARTILNSALESALMVTQYAADGHPQQIGDMCHVVDQ